MKKSSHWSVMALFLLTPPLMWIHTPPKIKATPGKINMEPFCKGKSSSFQTIIFQVRAVNWGGGVYPNKSMVSGCMCFFLESKGLVFAFWFLGSVGGFGHPSDPPGIKLVAWQVNSYGLLYPILVIGRRGVSGTFTILGSGRFTYIEWLIYMVYLPEWLIYMVHVGKYTIVPWWMLWIGSKHHPAAAMVGTHDRFLFLPFLGVIKVILHILGCSWNLDFFHGLFGVQGWMVGLNSNKEVNMLIETQKCLLHYDARH